MVCEKCGAENKKRAQFCENCGAKFERLGKTTTCSQCGKIVTTKYQFCGFCGADIWQGYQVQKAKQPKKRKLSGGKIVLVLSILTLAVIGAVLLGTLRYKADRIAVDQAREDEKTAIENNVIDETEEGLDNQDEQEGDEAKEVAELTDDEWDRVYEDFLAVGYDDGIYEVGVDIPEGVYFLSYNDTETYKYCKFHNAPSKDLLSEDVYQNTFYLFDVVYIKDGDFIELELCSAIPYAEVDWMIEGESFFLDDGYYTEGGYIVGEMIPAGVYEAVSEARAGSKTAYVIQVWDSLEQRRMELRQEAEASTDNVYFLSAGESMTISIEEGQVIYFDTIQLIPKNLAIMLPLIGASAF